MTETMEAPAQAAVRAPEDERERLQQLVAELVEKNQTLRFEVQTLRRKAGQAEKALNEACSVYRFLVP